MTDTQTLENAGRQVEYAVEGDGPVGLVLIPDAGLDSAALAVVGHYLAEEAGFHVVRVGTAKDASPAERAEAPRLYRVLQEVRDAVHTGTHSWATIEAEAMTELERHGWRPDYITVRRRADLLPPKDDDRELVVLGAARLGTPRLLDNLELTI